jgi:hypothetical protein
MGNRAIIKTEGGHIGLYLHWNGGRDSVEAFLTYCKLKGHRPPETDGYGWARLAQVVGNFFGGTTSVGIVETGDPKDGEWCDNGAYIIRNWEIIGRECFDGKEQNEYDLWDMLREIDKRQPEADRLGAYLDSVIVPVEDVKIGDVVTFIDWNGDVKTSPVIGIGEDITVNGTDVKGMPFLGLYGDDPEHNINNYLRDKTVRVLPKQAQQEESPVEIFINDQLKGIELKFKTRPTEEVRAELKAGGWKWHHKKALWYAKNDPEHLKKAQQIAAAAVK